MCTFYADILLSIDFNPLSVTLQLFKSKQVKFLSPSKERIAPSVITSQPRTLSLVMDMWEFDLHKSSIKESVQYL